MSDTRLIVTKTLVIGLGTSGVRVCEQLAGRIRWEYGDLKRIPWVRFLCLDTDTAGVPKSEGFDPIDFLPLTISANEYSEIVQFRKVYDDAIGLSRWADKETLEKIPNKAVDDGVGNIRMIGRLAFFQQRNYNRVRNSVQARLNDLRQLNEPDAAESLGVLADGSRPTISFAARSQVRIFVVGTLCGGTCSGLAGDFGFFLQSIAAEEEKSIGIFTLPHNSLSPAAVPAANRFKKNAYTALVELNHYHLGLADEIPFPGHPMRTKGVHPYDLPFLTMPHQDDETAIRALETAIKDRIFLNIFVPETDPFAGTVNASLMDRDGHAHAFCTFGLSSIEFPAQQVMEACTKRLMLKAVREWNSRSMPEGPDYARLAEAGIAYEPIKQSMLRVPEGAPIATRISDQVQLIIQSAKSSDYAPRQALTSLRAAFGGVGTLGGSAALPPGFVPTTVRSNIHSSAQNAYDMFRASAANRVLGYDEGPAKLTGLYSQARDVLAQMRQVSARDTAREEEDVDRALKAVAAGRHKKSVFSREMVADDAHLDALKRALTREIETKIERECQLALVSSVQDGRTRRGVVELIERLLEPGIQRAHNLRNRLTSLQMNLTREVEALSSRAPDVNGVALFDPEPRGTVRQEYERCLMSGKSELATSFEEEENRSAADVIRAWTGLIPALLPDSTSESGQAWLKDTYLIGSGEPIRPEDSHQLTSAARGPFGLLRGVNVLDYSKHSANEAEEVRRACATLRPFLNLDETHAMRGGREAIQKRQLVLLPAGDTDSELVQVIEAQTGIQQFRTSPDPNRVIMLEELYRFPLYGARDVVGNPHSLSEAQAGDFPTFHTRKDVYWTGLSDDDAARADKLERLVVVGILLKILESRDAALCMEWTPGGVGQEKEKRLPPGIKGAARALAFERAEIGGNVVQLKNAAAILEDRIGDKRKRVADSGSDGDLAFVGLLCAAFESGDYNHLSGWLEDNLGGRLLKTYCASDPGLYSAWCQVYEPDKARIALMRHRAGELRPKGGSYDQDGLYCLDAECCGWLGKDERDAALHGWRCYLNPAHDYAPT